MMYQIARAAVKIFDKRQGKTIIIPCHRHCDAFQILKEFGYRKTIDYYEIDQGFLDAKDSYLNRIEAKQRVIQIGQKVTEDFDDNCPELYSEELW